MSRPIPTLAKPRISIGAPPLALANHGERAMIDRVSVIMHLFFFYLFLLDSLVLIGLEASWETWRECILPLLVDI